MRTKRRFDEEFKREAIQLVKEGNKTAAEVARNLGVKVNTLHYWVNKSVEEKDGSIITDTEVSKLRRELESTKIERDILKKAVAIFSKQPK